jgi:hypothetical protein
MVQASAATISGLEFFDATQVRVVAKSLALD